MALVAEGRLGRIKRVQAAIGAAPSCPAIPVAEPAKEFNWDRWLGPALAVEYRFFQGPAVVDMDGKEKRPPANTNGHHDFRWWYEYSGGKLTDWGAHHVDIAMWALALNGQAAGPTVIGGRAKHPVEFKDGMPVDRDRYNTATEFLFTADFPGDTQLVIRHETDNGVVAMTETAKYIDALVRRTFFACRRGLPDDTKTGIAGQHCVLGKQVEPLHDRRRGEDAIKRIVVDVGQCGRREGDR